MSLGSRYGIVSLRCAYNQQNSTTKKWYVIDAEDQILGRLATKTSAILMGKNNYNITEEILKMVNNTN